MRHLTALVTILAALALLSCGPSGSAGSGSGSHAVTIPDDPVPDANAIAFAEDALSRAASESAEEQQKLVTAAEKALHGVAEVTRGDRVALSVVAVERAVGILVDPQIPLARRAAAAQIVLGAADAERTDDVARYGPALRHIGKPHNR